MRLSTLRPLFYRASILSLFLLVASDVSRASSALSCVFAQVRAEHQRNISEADYLNGFSFDQIDPSSVNMLSDNGVFKVRLKNGAEYVVRFATKDTDLEFESFASNLLREAPHLETPQTRIYSGAEPTAFYKTIEKMDWGVDLRIKMRQGFGGPAKNGTTQVSVAAYYPKMKIGNDHLADIGAFDGVRNTITDLSLNPSAMTLDDIERYKDLLKWQWDAMSEQAQLALLNDYKQAVPKAKNLTVDVFLAYLQRNVPRFSEQPLDLLVTLGLQRVPKDLKTQLADHWAIYTALGIQDFHADNWLIFKNKVLAIDLASKGKEFDNGAATLAMFKQQHPFGLHFMNRAILNDLKKNISAEMRAFLSSLDDQKIKMLADSAGFELTPTALSGIRARINLLLDPT